jgi:hypothetical protein
MGWLTPPRQAWAQQAPEEISPRSGSADNPAGKVNAPELPDAPLPDALQPQAAQPATAVSTAAIQDPATQPETDSARATIQGTVTNRDGALYEGVRVTLTRPATAAAAQTTMSDTNGHFLFTGLAAGPFVVTVSSAGFATQQVTGTLHEGESFQAPAIVLPVATATSEVRVTISQVEIAQEQLQDEEKQRVLGIFPNFYAVYGPFAAPLSSRQKFHLAWRYSIDPVTIGITGITAGVEQANNDFSGYGQGAQGYGKRFGAAYADVFVGNMLGGAVFPSLLKQDPRYFVKGTGSVRSRALYAISMAVICKGDNGHWQFDYSGILGGLASGGISNLYYPASDRNGAALTFENTLIGTAESAIGNLFQEFVARKFTPRLPKSAPSPSAANP